jgi:glycosyltransferase involved in cell wall biosynthesis
LDTWKGQEVFLRAMARVKDELPGAKGVIVGDPPPGKPECRERLLALSGELALSENLVFSAFYMDVPAIMSALDVLVLASTSPEPFGRVLIEAMAAGKPVIASDAGAAREIIENGVQGLLVPAGDAEALAHAIVHLLTHRDVATIMGQKGRARVRERFGMQAYVEGVQAIYREVLN